MEETEILRILNKYNPWWGNKPVPPSKTSSFKRGARISRWRSEQARLVIQMLRDGENMDIRFPLLVFRKY